ncbi:MAG: hypothetical protein JST90_16355 [Bacteroidetes bacterium]|nr:hypothetical protein [Bacteroidota bacterium]
MAKKNNGVQFAFDMHTKQMVGALKEGERNETIDDINFNIGKAIAAAFEKMTNWIHDFKKNIEVGNHVEAYNLFKLNQATLRLNKERILDVLLSLDRSVLKGGDRKKYRLIILAQATIEGGFEKCEKVIEELLSDATLKLPPNERQSIILSKANAAAKNQNYNTARSTYISVISNNNTSALDIAYAHRGLALISFDDEEKIYYHKLSSDKFLEAGNPHNAIIDLAHISTLMESKSPKVALEYIDKAISLCNLSETLNQELAASLYHKKAIYLHSLHHFNEAMSAINTACSYREPLIGNEHEKYSSYLFASILAKTLKNHEKYQECEARLIKIKEKIGSPYFDLQLKVAERMQKGEAIAENLMNKIEHVNDVHFILGAYLYNATNKKYLLEEKIQWIDKAMSLFQKKEITSIDKSLCYFTLAEIYRSENNLGEAIKNYEYSLNFNPFHWLSAQNYAATLWNLKEWHKAVIFLEKRAELLGETPNLVYGIARSHFELGNYNKAVNLFIKVLDKVNGVNIREYIDKCLMHSADLKIEYPAKQSPLQIDPISIESLLGTLKDFSKSISSSSRMHFWENIAGKHKWTTSPESLAKHFLITALKTKYGSDAIEIIQEHVSGAGVIDLYALLRGGLKVVIELKMCGEGYSSTYALSGEDQLIHYLGNNETHLGFLIVFDARIRDFGKEFKNIQVVNNKTIYTEAIDVRHSFEKKKRKGDKIR